MSSQQLEAIRTGSLPLSEVLGINEHVRACPECAQHVALANNSPKRIETLRRVIEREDETTFHISPDELSAYALGRADGRREEIVESHLEFCTTCLEDLEDLRSLKRPRSSARRPGWTEWLAAAAAILVVTTALITYRRGEPSAPRSPQPIARHETLKPPTAVLGPAPASESRSYGRADWDRAVASARQLGAIVVNARVATLRSPRSNLRNLEQPARTLHALNPDGEFVATTRPTFRWHAPAGATSVVVISTSSGLLLSSKPLTSATWQPPQALQPGTTYSWQVEVTDGDEVTLVPAPPDPPVLFRVLPQDARAELAEAKRRFPNDHLLLAVLHARHGVLATARTELEMYLAAENPPNAASLRKSLAAPRP